MCGLVGIISKVHGGLFQTDVDFFENMLMCDMVRGMDSTGSFTILRSHQARVLKHDSHPMNLFATPAWPHYARYATQHGLAIIGHNRAATKGNITNDNAHPFFEGDIVLVHNGTIHNHKDLKNTEVDSHAICHSFSDIGYKETLKKINGAWALVWYNMHEHKLYLTRNEERPLAYVETATNIYFASEVGMLQWLLIRENRPILKENIHVLAPYDLITIGFDPFTKKVENIKNEVTPEVFLPPTVITGPASYMGGGYRGADVLGAGDDDDDYEDVVETGIVARRSLPPQTTQTMGHSMIIHPMFKVYPRHTKVVFVPLSVTEGWEDGRAGKRFKVHGKAYLPGNPVMNARGMIPQAEVMDIEEAREWMKVDKMIGEVMSIAQDKNKSEWLQLTQLKPDVSESTWGDSWYPITELKYIASHYACDKCAGRIDMNYIRGTSIHAASLNIIKKVTCHECVEKNKEDMPAVYKEKVMTINHAL